jgi:hypothetical protein
MFAEVIDTVRWLLPRTTVQAFLSLAAIWTVYKISLVLYRLTLHPLARAGIPGPKLAAATWWWEFYHEVRADGRES